MTMLGACKHNTFVADHLVAVVFLGELVKGRLNDATLQVKHQVQSGVFLDIVV